MKRGLGLCLGLALLAQGQQPLPTPTPLPPELVLPGVVPLPVEGPAGVQTDERVFIFNFMSDKTQAVQASPSPSAPTPSPEPQRELPLKPEIQSFLYELLYIPFIPVAFNRSLIALQALQGQVSRVSRNAEGIWRWDVARTGEIVWENNRIHTDVNSSVILEFPEELGFGRLFPQSELEVKELMVLPSLEGEQIMRFQLDLGSVLFKIRDFNRRRSLLAINTPGIEVFVTGIKLFPPYKRRLKPEAMPRPTPTPAPQQQGEQIIIDKNGQKIIINLNGQGPPPPVQPQSYPQVLPYQGSTIAAPFSESELLPYLTEMEPEAGLPETLYEGIFPESVLNTAIEKIILDPGATFMVTVSSGGTTSVTVAEGAVLVRSRGQAIVVEAGEVIRVIPGEPPTIAKGILVKEELFLNVEKVAAEGDSVVITGSTDRTASLTVNGRPQNVDIQGRFIVREKLQPGLTILRLFAQTPDGRKRVREIVIQRLGG